MIQTPELESTIVHDLAGSMTSVTGLAEIVAARPELPSRETLIKTLAGEAKNATQAVRDLQLVRAIAADSVAEVIGPIAPSVWFDQVKERLSSDHAAALAPPPPGLPAVHADEALLVDLLVRVSALGASIDGSSILRASAEAGSVTFDVPTTLAAEELIEGRRTGRKHLRPLALADLLLARWGGRLVTEEVDGVAYIRFVLPIS